MELSEEETFIDLWQQKPCLYDLSNQSYSNKNKKKLDMRSGTWYVPHNHVHNKRTVPIITAGCIAHVQNGHISTSGLKSNFTIVFLDPDFLQDAQISAIWP